MDTTLPSSNHGDSLEVLLDKISHMREELLTIERALERMQREAVN